MVEDSLEAVYAYVERAYVRLQASEMLVQCLEAGDMAPMRILVEELVLAGPQSLSILREVLAEVSSHKTQLQDDLYQVYFDLEKKFESYGLNLPGLDKKNSLTQVVIQSIYKQKGTIKDSARVNCLQLLRSSEEMVLCLTESINLLDEVEVYLRDWMWSLIYQFTHQEWTSLSPGTLKYRLL